MSKKFILQITGMTCTKYGETERFLIDLVKFSRRLNYHSILQYESVPTPKSYLKHLEELNAKVIIKPVNKGPIKAAWNVARLIGSIRPEIIHTHFAERFGLFFIPIFGRIFGVRKIIAEVHNVSGKKDKYPKLAYDQFDHVLTCSAAVKDELVIRGVNPRLVAVQYLGLRAGHEFSQELRKKFRSEFGISQDSIVFACIAFDTEFKGLDVLLKAFQNITRKHKDLHLISIGVDPKLSSLPNLAQELGISQQVHWAGIRDNGWEVLNAADVYVQPSRSCEGLGLSILEAMSLKLPVVCTTIGGMVEVVKDGLNGIWAEPNNSESLANALERMIELRAKWPLIGNAGYNRYLELFQGGKLREELVNKYYKSGSPD